ACLGGKRFETRESQGVMNFVALMLTKGTETLTELDVARKVEDMGGRLGAFSGMDSIGLDATFVSRNLERGLELLAQIYSNPSFPDDKMGRERKLIINRIKTAPDRPVEFAVKILNETMYTRHPYGFSEEGTIETVTKFSRDDLISTHRRYFVPSNTVITGVGDLDVSETLQLINRLFGRIPATPLITPGILQEEPSSGVTEKTVRIPRAKAHLVIGFHGTTRKDEDRYALDVLNNLLAGMGGRLFRELRDKESLAYTVASFVRPSSDPGIFALYIATDHTKVDTALQGLIREIREVRRTHVTDAELERAINNLIGRRQIALQSPWARAENMALNDLY
ncbi:MAG: insulinase family protein, partial [Deltaproteobacteria bacterium]|nr:insulinase family protein [Deltaproteobacteria bacterium]